MLGGGLAVDDDAALRIRGGAGDGGFGIELGGEVEVVLVADRGEVVGVGASAMARVGSRP